MSEQKDLERADFEKWAASVGYHTERDRFQREHYQSTLTWELWRVWQARASLPVGVPNGYMPIPTAEQLADALDGVSCYHDLSAELIAPRLLANLLASTTVKAEQVQCKTCNDTAMIGDLPIECPDCCHDEVHSLPAAGSADLTAVRCQCCATEYPHDSYDAGFIAGSGMCQVCDAAMPPKDLPAAEQSAPGEVEEVEVRGLQWLDTGHYRKKPPQFGYNPHDWNPLMTVAQHKRLMAAEIQKRFDGNEQSSREHREELAQLAARDDGEVRVPVELAERIATHLEWDGEESLTVVQYANKCDALAAELRALLNGGEA